MQAKGRLQCWNADGQELGASGEGFKRFKGFKGLKAGNSVQDGFVTEKGIVYRCPFCKGNVRSDVRTGRIDHRTVCGNQFCVKDSAVSKNTRCHAHSCPVCSTVVWSSQSCGRIAVTHVTPSGKRCQTKHWHVPDKKAKKRKK